MTTDFFMTVCGIVFLYLSVNLLQNSEDPQAQVVYPGGICVFKSIKKALLYNTDSVSTQKTVLKQIMEENRKFVIIWASVQMLYWGYCMILSIKSPDFILCRNLYIMAFSICAAALVLAILAAPKAPWLIRPLCLAVDIAFLGAGIGIARFLAPKTVMIFASVLIVPVFFITDTLTTLILFILNAAAFVAIGKTSMEAETFRWTMTNLIIFSSIGLVVGYFVNKARFERFVFAESAMQLAESNAKLAELQTTYAYYDQMTGLQNRRAYAEKTDQYKKNMPSGCCVVMADINGLKEMNDRRGHDAGDELIIGSAECLRQSFHHDEWIYRIGGDEFSVIMDGTAENVEDCLKQLDTAASQWKGKYVNGISISCGYASDKEFDDFDSMLKAADERMYEFKSNYYRITGKDRRQR